jgi:hypothetical protein
MYKSFPHTVYEIYIQSGYLIFFQSMLSEIITDGFIIIIILVSHEIYPDGGIRRVFTTDTLLIWM